MFRRKKVSRKTTEQVRGQRKKDDAVSLLHIPPRKSAAQNRQNWRKETGEGEARLEFEPKRLQEREKEREREILI